MNNFLVQQSRIMPKKSSSSPSKTTKKKKPVTAKKKPKKPVAAKKKRTPVKKVVRKRKTPAKSSAINLTTAQAKARMGGSFPNLNGRKHKYPPPSNEKAWTLLVNRALRMRQREVDAYKAGRKPPVCKLRTKYVYLLYNCTPKAKWKRATRNSHRKRAGLTKGDPRVVHHHDQRTMSYASTEIMDRCQHKRVHGNECITPE